MSVENNNFSIQTIRLSLYGNVYYVHPYVLDKYFKNYRIEKDTYVIDGELLLTSKTCNNLIKMVYADFANTEVLTNANNLEYYELIKQCISYEVKDIIPRKYKNFIDKLTAVNNYIGYGGRILNEEQHDIIGNCLATSLIKLGGMYLDAKFYHKNAIGNDFGINKDNKFVINLRSVAMVPLLDYLEFSNINVYSTIVDNSVITKKELSILGIDIFDEKVYPRRFKSWHYFTNK